MKWKPGENEAYEAAGASKETAGHLWSVVYDLRRASLAAERAIKARLKAVEAAETLPQRRAQVLMACAAARAAQAIDEALRAAQTADAAAKAANCPSGALGAPGDDHCRAVALGRLRSVVGDIEKV